MGEVDLSGVESKLEWARTRADELEQQVTATFAPETHSFTFERDTSNGVYVARVHGLPQVDPGWTLLLGEVLFHLRSCLDHLAHQIILFEDLIPSDTTMFPIRDSPYNKKGVYSRSQLRPPIANKQILDVLEVCQPYRNLDGSLDIDGSLRSALRALHKLNIIDKHRILLITAAVLDLSNMWWGLPPDFPPPRVLPNPGVLVDHGPVAYFNFGSVDPPSHFDPHPAVQVSIREPTVAYLTRVSIPHFLDNLFFWVAEFIIGWRIGPILEGREPFMDAVTIEDPK